MVETWNPDIKRLTNGLTEEDDYTHHQIYTDEALTEINEDLTYLMARNGYLVDFNEADQGAAGGGGTIKDLVDAIGTTKQATIFLPHTQLDQDTTTYTLSTSLLIPRNISLVFQRGAILSIDSGKTFTPLGPIVAGFYKIFTGDGSISFSWNKGTDLNVKVAWWGAVGDNSTSGTINSAAFTAAIAALPSANVVPTLVLDGGRYNVAGNPGVLFNKNMKVIGNKAILDYETETGVCVQVGDVTGSALSDFYISDVQVTRTTGSSGIAATDLTETGFLFQNVKNFTADRMRWGGFGIGLSCYGNEQGISYGTFNKIHGGTSLVNIKIDNSDSSDSFATFLTFNGGRTVYADSTYNTLAKTAGSRLIHIINSNTDHQSNAITFNQVAIENLAERKVEIGTVGSSNEIAYVTFNDCYWDTGSATGGSPYTGDIEDASSTNGSAVLTKASHGLSITIGDKITITDSSTAADEGDYSVVSFTDDTITLNATLTGTETDVDFSHYRTNILLQENTRNIILNCGNGLSQQTIVDLGTTNLAYDPIAGISLGPATSDYRAYISGSDEYLLALKRSGSSNTWALGLDSLRFYLADRDGIGIIMAWLETGNVGIGTTGPSYKLEVNGTAFATMLRQTNTWHAYGGFEDQAETVTCGAGDWNHITNAGTNLWNLDENDGITISGDALTLTNAGDYEGVLSLSISAINGKDFHVRVYNNTQTAVCGRPMGISTTGAGNEMNVCVPIYIEAAASDAIQFEISSADGTDPVVDDGLFIIKYLHD